MQVFTLFFPTKFGRIFRPKRWRAWPRKNQKRDNNRKLLLLWTSYFNLRQTEKGNYTAIKYLCTLSFNPLSPLSLLLASRNPESGKRRGGGEVTL